MRKPCSVSSIGLALFLPVMIGAAAPCSDAPSPTVSVTTNGNTSGYAVRFSGPVDHRSARLLITQDGQVLQSLGSRLDSAPTVLFARNKALPPGTYNLHWTARSMTADTTCEGDVSFSIEPPAH
jgi:methionine-rich copper-binding protein CopC